VAKKGFQHKRLLDIKALILDLKSLALRESEGIRRNRARHLGELRTEKQVHLKTGNHSTAGRKSLFSRDLQIHTWYTEQLNEDLRRQIHEVRRAEQEVQERRKVVERSVKDKKSLEKLKEHQDHAARREIERQEQRRLDEIAGHQRSRSGGPESP